MPHTLPRLSVALLCVALVAAKAAKAPSDPPGDLFFTMKGQPHALERTFPGITAALMLTDEQKTKLNEIYHQTVASPELRAKGSSLKNNPAATDADRDAFRNEVEKARADVQQQAAAILTPEQKMLIEKIQTAASDAQRNARESLKDEFAASKGDNAKAADLKEKVRVEAEDLFAQQLEKILAPDQMSAVRQAAAAQRANEEQARKNKLGK